MSETTVVDVFKIKKVFGDRILVRRLGEPEKKRGILVPQSYLAGKKEPRKAWFGLVIAKGIESKVKVQIGDRVGIEPLGQHYATFKGADDHEYMWVPDEHIAFKDKGSVLAYYEDRLDRKSDPLLQLLGDRILVREAPKEETSKIIRPVTNDKNEAKLADVVLTATKDFKEGERVVHVAADSGSSASLDIFEPPFTILRTMDVIAKLHPAKETACSTSK